MSDSGRADALLADLPRDGRGRLKVFLGAAPGVGKTYAMLQAAHTQLRQGVKVIAGVVETHGRAETEALLGDRLLALLDTVANAPADGRGWNQASPTKSWAISEEPRTLPSASRTRLPLA